MIKAEIDELLLVLVAEVSISLHERQGSHSRLGGRGVVGLELPNADLLRRVALH